MRFDLILPQFVLLDVIYVLAACMQTIHVPLITSRRMPYSRIAVCIYEASLVVHLAIVADILLLLDGQSFAGTAVCHRACSDGHLVA